MRSLTPELDALEKKRKKDYILDITKSDYVRFFELRKIGIIEKSVVEKVINELQFEIPKDILGKLRIRLLLGEDA